MFRRQIVRPFYHLSFFYLKSITGLNSRGGLWSWYVSKKGWRRGGLLINLRLDSNKNRHYLRVCYYIPHTWQVMRLEVALVMFMYAKVNYRGSVIRRVCMLLSYGKCITWYGQSMFWVKIAHKACTNKNVEKIFTLKTEGVRSWHPVVKEDCWCQTRDCNGWRHKLKKKTKSIKL